MTTELTWPLAAPTPDPDPTPPSGIPAIVGDRLIMFTRGPKFRAIVETFGARTQALVDAAEDIHAAFDLDTAEGMQLDHIGAILQRPRFGKTDARYRILLKIQIELILSSAATTPAIMRIVELFTGEPPTEYAEFYPMAYVIGAVVDPSDVPELVGLLREATSAAYGFGVAIAGGNYMIADYTPADPVDGAGIADYTTADPVAGAGLAGYVFS